MKKSLIRATFAAGLLTIFASTAIQAGEREIHTKKVIAIDTGTGTLSELDISDLRDGEAMQMVGEDGTLIDILQSADGIELYIDGELQTTLNHAFNDIDDDHTQLMTIDCEARVEEEVCLHTMSLAEEKLAMLDSDEVSRVITIDCSGDEDCGDLSWVESLEEHDEIHLEKDVSIIRIHRQETQDQQ